MDGWMVGLPVICVQIGSPLCCTGDKKRSEVRSDDTIEEAQYRAMGKTIRSRDL